MVRSSFETPRSKKLGPQDERGDDKIFMSELYGKNIVPKSVRGEFSTKALTLAISASKF